MNNDDFQTIIKGNIYKQLFNPNQNYLCLCCDENEFIINFLNVFSLNFRSLPKNGGAFMNFLGNQKTEFRVIIPTEICSRNLTVVKNLFTIYTFVYIEFTIEIIGEAWVYIYTTLYQTWECSNGTVRNVMSRVICWIHAQRCKVQLWCYLLTPNGNTHNFVLALECVLHKINKNRTTVSAGGIASISSSFLMNVVSWLI